MCNRSFFSLFLGDRCSFEIHLTLSISFNHHDKQKILFSTQLIYNFQISIVFQTPRFWLFVFIPGVLFIIDKIISLQTRYMELDILETELLPSGKFTLKLSQFIKFTVHLILT